MVEEGGTMKLGRNDPCHCGSGRKYKHCHYDQDRAAEADELRRAEEERAAAAAAEKDQAESEDGDARPDGSAGKAAARAASTGRPKPGGSRFMRDSSHGGRDGGRSQTGTSGGSTARVTRGAQRGG